MLNLYFRISDPSDVRDLGEQMAAWELADNPKANFWALTPEKPDPNAVWQDGQWVIKETIPPLYTAEEWVQQYFSNLEVIALMRLEQAILNQGKTLGPKMTACKQWLEGMMFAQPSSSFPVAPYSYSETSAEAAQTLSSN
jgi:hypothetical protein